MKTNLIRLDTNNVIKDTVNRTELRGTVNRTELRGRVVASEQIP